MVCEDPAAKVPLAAWLAVITQAPGDKPVTSPVLLTEQGEDGAVLKVTALPEPPPVAVTVAVPPCNTVGKEPQAMFCVVNTMPMFWVICVAAV